MRKEAAFLMEDLKEVLDARSLMTEAQDWSVMKWLTEKKRVRQVADKANETLDRVEQELQDSWDEELKAAYADASRGNSRGRVSPETEKAVKGIWEAHEAAMKGRQDAEDAFQQAEKRMSTRLAREGCEKAIAGWDLHELAIRKAQLVPTKK
jgi:uncharacterized protein YaaN involved in tellurite resistance